MGNPFRVNAPAPATKKAEQVASPAPGKHIVRSQQTGDPLPTPASDVPDHSPLIPWPAAEAPTHKPMKLNK